MLAVATGCWLLLVAAAAAASPGGIFEDYLKKNLKKNLKKKCRKFLAARFLES
jgi:hypothetical protein